MKNFFEEVSEILEFLFCEKKHNIDDWDSVKEPCILVDPFYLTFCKNGSTVWVGSIWCGKKGIGTFSIPKDPLDMTPEERYEMIQLMLFFLLRKEVSLEEVRKELKVLKIEAFFEEIVRAVTKQVDSVEVIKPDKANLNHVACGNFGFTLGKIEEKCVLYRISPTKIYKEFMVPSLDNQQEKDAVIHNLVQFFVVANGHVIKESLVEEAEKFASVVF